jgi:putative endonuclease
MGLVRFIANLFPPFGRRFSRSPEPGENGDQWLGREGERLAARHLRRNGYKILYRNFRAPHGGEVDLVCRDKSCDTLVFIEVKSRRGLGYGAPAEAVTRDKQKLIARGALAWLRMLDHPDILIRFDIVEVVVEEERPVFNVIKDAFTLPEPYVF